MLTLQTTIFVYRSPQVLPPNLNRKRGEGRKKERKKERERERETTQKRKQKGDSNKKEKIGKQAEETTEMKK